MRELSGLEAEFSNADQQQDNFVIIAFGRDHDMNEMIRFKAQKGFSFLISPDKDRTVFELFARSFVPRSYMIDREGIIVFQKQGFEEGGMDLLKFNILKTLKNP